MDYGIDVSLLEENLARSYAERFKELVRLTAFAANVEAARVRLHGSGE